jgi:Sulfotransferase domain
MSKQAGELKIIGAGFGRTGTLSLKAALEELGFGPCYHMTEVFGNPGHIAYWVAATEGKPVDWKDFLNNYQATVDWPACAFYKELMRVYPDAKVLLTVRNPESWYESVRSTIYQVSRRATGSPFTVFIASLQFPDRLKVGRMVNALVWQGTFDGKFEDKEYALAVFQRHIEEVKKNVPTEKLLIYDVKQGWEPLCAFLGVDIPADKPFPHLNERANFIGNRLTQRSQRQAVGVVLGVGVLAALFFLRRRSK